jgi:hypothetical protein
MKNKTAVEWLVEQIIARQNGNGDKRTVDEIFEQAKAMEREQIIDAVNQTEFENIEGLGICEDISKGEQYYNETYGG